VKSTEEHEDQKLKVKIKLSLCITKHRAMKTYQLRD